MLLCVAKVIFALQNIEQFIEVETSIATSELFRLPVDLTLYGENANMLDLYVNFTKSSQISVFLCTSDSVNTCSRSRHRYDNPEFI